MSTQTAEKKTKTLYELTGDYEQIMFLLEQADEEGDKDFGEMLRDTLDAIDGSIEQKLEALVKVRKNYEAEAEMFKAEKMKLERKQKIANNQADRIEKYIDETLTRLGFDAKNKKKVSAGLFKIQYNKIAPGIRIADKTKIPARFLIPQDAVIDRVGLLAHAKSLITDANKDQDEIKLEEIGVVVENSKQTLSIK